jgi:hypothetical protein
MNSRKWYGLTDGDNIVYLGEHEDFFGADDRAQELGQNYVWLFDAETWVQWTRQVKEQTP